MKRLVLLLLFLPLLLLVAGAAALRLYPGGVLRVVDGVLADEIRAETIQVRYLPLTVTLQGLTYRPATAVAPLLQADVASMEVRPLRWLGAGPFWSLRLNRAELILPESPAAGDAAPAPAAAAVGRLDLAGLIRFAELSVEELHIRLPGQPVVGLSLQSRRTGHTYPLDLKLDYNGLRLAGQGLLEPAAPRLTLALGELDLTPLLQQDPVPPAEPDPGLAPPGAAEGGNAPLQWALLERLPGFELILSLDTLRLPDQHLSELSATLRLPSAGPELDFAGRWHAVQQAAVPFAGTLALVPPAVATEGAFARLEATLALADARVHLAGPVNLTGYEGTSLAMDLAVTGLGELSAFAPPILTALWPLEARAELFTEPGGLRLNNLLLRYADSDLAGSLALQTQGTERTVTGRLQSSRLVLPLQAADTTEADPAEAETAASDSVAVAEGEPAAAESAGPVFAREPLDWRWLDGLTMDLALTAAELRIGEAPFTQFDAALRADEGRLVLAPLRAAFGGGGFDGQAELVKQAQGVAASLQFDLSGVRLDAFGLTSESTLTGGDTALALSLTSSGASPHELAAALAGTVLLTVTDAVVQNDTFELIGSDLLMELMTKLNPFARKDPTTALTCALARFDVVDGVLTTRRQIVIETGKMEIVGDGSIDLGEETLDIGFSPSAKGGVGLNVGSLVKFLRVGGPLRAPRPVADAAGLVQSGAALGAAVSTGGLSLVAEGMFKRLANAGNACDRALADAPVAETP